MEQTHRFDPRLTELTQSVKNMATPQTVYHDKAKNVRAQRIDGIVHLYRHDDIIAINRHPAIRGNGGRGATFGDAPLIPLEIDGADHKKWRRLLDPLFAPKQIAGLEAAVRALAAELLDRVLPAGTAELHDDFCVPLPCLTFLRFIGAPTEDLDFFLEFKNGVLHPAGDTAEEMHANVGIAGARLVEYFSTFLAQRREDANHHDDVIAALIRSAVDGEPISDTDLLNILFLLMFAGLDTVTASLSCILGWPVNTQTSATDSLLTDRSFRRRSRS
jgi:cytochrome P450